MPPYFFKLAKPRLNKHIFDPKCYRVNRKKNKKPIGLYLIRLRIWYGVPSTNFLVVLDSATISLSLQKYYARCYSTTKLMNSSKSRISCCAIMRLLILYEAHKGHVSFIVKLSEFIFNQNLLW